MAEYLDYMNGRVIDSHHLKTSKQARSVVSHLAILLCTFASPQLSFLIPQPLYFLALDLVVQTRRNKKTLGSISDPSGDNMPA